MLCAIQKFSGLKISARSADKCNRPFFCPRCGREVSLRKGQIKVHHFAHKPSTDCHFGRGETEAHLRAKESIANALTEYPDTTLVEIEKDWGSVVSDVFAIIKGHKIAFEVQASSLSVEKISHRTKAYHDLGIAVLWLPLFNKKLNMRRYTPAPWEKWLHAVHYGRVYYWLEGLTVVPVRFGDYLIAVESTSWYDSGGSENYSGGYDRKSKRWKTPVLYESIQVPQDFVLRRRSQWGKGGVIIPDCRILVDKENAKRKERSLFKNSRR